MEKNEIIEKVKNHMKFIKLEFDENYGIRCRDKEFIEIRDETQKEIYKVSFRTPDHVEKDSKGNIKSVVDTVTDALGSVSKTTTNGT